MSDIQKLRSVARISPDRRWVGVTAIVLVMIIMAASHVFSYAMIADAAAWSGVPFNAEWVRFLAPIYIDGAIITYTLAYSIFHWRAEERNALQARRWLRFFTGLSMLINGLHAAGFWEWNLSKYEAWAGITISMMAPFAALAAAEQIVKLLFEKPGAEVDKTDVGNGLVVAKNHESEAEPGVEVSRNLDISPDLPIHWEVPPVVTEQNVFRDAS